MKIGYIIKRPNYVDRTNKPVNDLSQASLFKSEEDAREVAQNGDEIIKVMVAKQSNQKWMKKREESGANE